MMQFFSNLLSAIAALPGVYAVLVAVVGSGAAVLASLQDAHWGLVASGSFVAGAAACFVVVKLVSRWKASGLGATTADEHGERHAASARSASEHRTGYDVGEGSKLTVRRGTIANQHTAVRLHPNSSAQSIDTEIR